MAKKLENKTERGKIQELRGASPAIMVLGRVILVKSNSNRPQSDTTYSSFYIKLVEDTVR